MKIQARGAPSSCRRNDAAIESGLRRATELLRLTVATFGGVVVIAGILAARDFAIDGWALGWLALGTALLVGAAAILARVLAGSGETADFAFGPDIHEAVDVVDDPGFTERAVLRSLVVAAPTWIDGNKRLIQAVERSRGRALKILAAGVGALMFGLFYIAVGAILG